MLWIYGCKHCGIFEKRNLKNHLVFFGGYLHFFWLHAILKFKLNLNISCSLQWNCFSTGKLKAIVKILKAFSKFLGLKGKAGSSSAALLKYILKSSPISSLVVSVEYATGRRIRQVPLAFGYHCCFVVRACELWIGKMAFWLNPAINHKCQCLSRAQRTELCNLQWLVILCMCNYIVTQSCQM